MSNNQLLQVQKMIGLIFKVVKTKRETMYVKEDPKSGCFTPRTQNLEEGDLFKLKTDDSDYASFYFVQLNTDEIVETDALHAYEVLEFIKECLEVAAEETKKAIEDENLFSRIAGFAEIEEDKVFFFEGIDRYYIFEKEGLFLVYDRNDKVKLESIPVFFFSRNPLYINYNIGEVVFYPSFIEGDGYQTIKVDSKNLQLISKIDRAVGIFETCDAARDAAKKLNFL